MSTTKRAMVAAMVLMMTSLGCSTLNWGKTSAPEDDIAVESITVEGGMLAVEGRFGIPIPSGLVFDRNSSFTFENDDVRVGKLVYNGKGNVAEIAQFFLEEMPGDGWIPGNIIEHNEVRVRFSNPSAGEEIEVSARQESWGNVSVWILLVPSGPSRVGGL